MSLPTRILIGLVAGLVVGLAANLSGIEQLQAILGGLQPFGTAWIRLITMIVIPLVVASLLVGTASLGDLRKVGRIGGKTLAYYMVTTAIAATIGLVISQVIEPGSGIDPATRDALSAELTGQAQGSILLAAEKPSTVETLLNMIPRNPVAAAANMDLLPLIVFTIIFGAAVSTLQEDRKNAVLGFFNGVNDASMVVINWVMVLAPYAVFALIGSIVANFGLDLLRSLITYALVVVLGLALHVAVTYSLAARFLAGLSPVPFFKSILKAPLIGVLDVLLERHAAVDHGDG